ncbi:MAG: hypothetical protein K5931_01555 [Lachnospiraceae bacterium]|nr:hypothetical protein [Lachnospiraceae bacterium]
MNNMISSLFDYQRFDENKDLKKIIDRVSDKYGIGKHGLSDDELTLVNAAGSIESYKKDTVNNVL